MRNLRYSFILLLLACLLSAVLTVSAENYVEQGGQIPDQNVYWGTRESTYLQILNAHKDKIQQYESRTAYYNDIDDTMPCRPVGFIDITGDGIPELVFMEIGTADGRGDLFVYTSNGSSTHCALYVPGIAYPDYDYWLGFDIYLSYSGGNTLVIEHLQYETPWTLQFSYDGQRYNLVSYATVDEDHSGEGYDMHYVNGQLVSYYEYSNVLDALQNAKYRVISEYYGPDYAYYGFGSTWSSAVQSLGGTAGTKSAYGYVQATRNRVNLRRSPNGEVFREVVLNSVWPVTGPTENKGGYTWYPVNVDGQAGYLRGDCVRKLSDAEAEAWLAGKDVPTAPPYAGNQAVYGLTIDKLATRKGPGTQYEGGGTYSVKGQYIQVLAKAYDKRNGIWWVKCVIPYKGEERILWTGYKRFDSTTLSLDQLPEEKW